MSFATIRQQVLEYRKTLTPRQRVNTYKKKNVWRYPYGLERKLNTAISNIFRGYVKKVNDAIVSGKPTYALYSKVVRTDSYQSEIDNYIVSLENSVSKNGPILPAVPTATVASFSSAPLVEAILLEIRKFSEAELTKYLKSILNGPIPYSEEWWPLMRKQWKDLLETKISGNIIVYLEKVKDAVVEGVYKEIPYEKLLEKITQLGNSLSIKRAEFVARDLVGTYTSVVNKHLQSQVLGFPFYSWGTALDEKVRGRPDGEYPKAIPSHWVMQNVWCKWSDPTVFSTDLGRTWQPRTSLMPLKHPGEDFGCRCVSYPVDENLFKEIDKILAQSNNK